MPTVWMGLLVVLLSVVSAALPAAAQDSGPGSWGRRAPLLEANSEMSVAELGGKIYLAGGQAGNRSQGPFVDTVYEYDSAANAWASKAPMPTARSSGAAAVVDGKIYVAGGRPPHGHDFAVFDPRANAWKPLPDLPIQRNHLAAAAVDGKVYVLGGRYQGGATAETSDVVEVYDPRTNAWAPRAKLPRPRGGVNSVEALGCIHLFGGEGNKEHPGGMFPDHDVYDPRTDRWTRLDPMPMPVHGVTGLAFFDGLIHLPGGGTAQGGASGSTMHQVYRPRTSCR